VNALVARIRSSRRASTAVVAGAVVVLALVAWVVVVSPKRADASRTTTQIAATQGQLQLARQQAATVRRTKALAAAVQRALPQNADEPGILDNLQAAGKHTGVLVSGVTPTATATLANAVALTVNVQGSYFQIRDFLHRLRTQVNVKSGGKVTAAGRLFDVTGVNIQQPSQGSTALTAVLTVNAYLYAPTTTPTVTPDATSAQATAAGSPN
jgi:Tfp pilus assembly protein PilO